MDPSLEEAPVAPTPGTRTRILRALVARPKTVSELSRDLRLDKAGVHRHLAHLCGAGLVERRSDTRKWVYYRLTPEGHGVAVAHGRTVLALWLGSATCLLAAAWAFAATLGDPGVHDWRVDDPVADGRNPPAPPGATGWAPLAVAALLAFALLLALLAWRRQRRGAPAAARA